MHTMTWEGLLDEAHSLRGRRGYLFTRLDKQLYRGTIYNVMTQGGTLFIWLDDMEIHLPGWRWIELPETIVCLILQDGLGMHIVNDEGYISMLSPYGPITIAPPPTVKQIAASETYRG